MKLECKRRDNHVSLFFEMTLPFSKKFRFHTMLYNSPNAWVHGYSSRTQNGRYVLFHDYDNLDLQAVVDELKYLQKRFKLSDYYIFELDRENSFHAVCLDTFSLSQAYDIQKATSCDLAFIHSIKRLQSKEWILRWDKKGDRGAPEYLLKLESKFSQRKKSLAHGLFLKKLGVDLDVRNSKEWDGLEYLAMVDYDTANRIGK